MTVPGMFLYILASIIKYSLSGTDSTRGLRMLIALRIDFLKGSAFSVFSILQLLGIFWIGFGLIELIAGAYIEKIPGPLLFALELFVPLGLVFYLAHQKMR